jgi:hypothetical protein
MRESRYTLISTAIDKPHHIATYAGSARNPYALALDRSLERLVGMLEHHHQREVVLLAEKRGDREDAELRDSFDHFVRDGTFTVSAARARAIRWTLHFIPKRMNCIGHQIADLAGAPIATHVLNTIRNDPTSNQAYQIITSKLYARGLSGGVEILPQKRKT